MKLKDKLYLLLAPAMTAALVLLIYNTYALYPFGDNSLAWCDMTQQALPLMMQAGNLLSGKTEGLYSLFTAGGMNLIGVFLFFVASPFTLLSPLIDGANFLLWANMLVLFKMMLASFTGMIWLDYLTKGRNRTINCILACSYAVSGYNLMYYQNNIWMDIVYLFPLLLLYTIRMLQGKGRVGFILLLSLTIFTNYYISFSVILFLLFFSAIYIYFDKKQLPRDSSTCLGIGVLCSLLLTAPAWLTSFLQYLSSARSDDSTIGTHALLTHITTTLGTFLPTALVLGGLLLVLFQHHRKPLTLTFAYSLVLMVIPVVLDPINRIWHLGSYQAFPVRYAFIPILLGLTLVSGTVDSYRMKNKASITKLPVLLFLIVGIIGTGILAILLLNTELREMTSYISTLWVSKESFRLLLTPYLLCFLLYLLAFLAYRYKHLCYKGLATIFALIMCIEVLFSGSVYMGGAARNGTYFYWIDDLSGQISDSEFYRVKTQKKLFDVNWLGAIGYPNLGHYTSLTTQDYLFTAKALGYSAYWMEVGPYGGSILSDIFLQNDYLISQKNYQSPLDEEMVFESDAYRIWKQKYDLPLGAIVEGSPTRAKKLPDLPRMQSSEKMFNLLYQGNRTLVTPYSFTTMVNTEHTMYGDSHHIERKDTTYPSTIHYSLSITKPTALYYDCFDGYSNKLREPINSSLSVYVNGMRVADKYPSQNNNGLLFLGLFDQEDVEIEILIHKDFSAHSLGLYGLDLTALEETIIGAPEREIHLAIDGDSYMGTAYNPYEKGFLVLPFPYDKGFQLTVNGKTEELKQVLGCFMAIPLQSGDNTFSLHFVPVGLKLSLGLFGFGVLLLLLIAPKNSRFLRILSPLYTGINLLFYLVALGGIIVVYIAPMISYFRA